MSRAGRFYDDIYRLLCGSHPRLRPWHFQWLSVVYLYRDLRRVLPSLRGDVLDVGCGSKPYRRWLGEVNSYTGIDVLKGVDVVIEPDLPWPFKDGSFDSVLCSQVLEHVQYLPLTLAEIDRVLRPGGRVVLTVPFIYNGHGEPQDFRRFSADGASALLPGMEIVEAVRQGAAGSTIGQLFLNWLESATNRYPSAKYLKGLLLPFWVAFSAGVNLCCFLWDSLDRTGSFYSNVLLVARKHTGRHDVP